MWHRHSCLCSTDTSVCATLEPRMPKLVLFDIDGTLITDGGAARDAFAAALADVYGFRGELRQYDFSGRTDPQIAHMVLRGAGFSEKEIDAHAINLWDRYVTALAQNVDGRVRDALRNDERITLGLLTGNIQPGARLKLGPPSLNDYFPFGAFGSDSPRREDLPPIAIERAAAFGGRRFAGRDVVIIGDSIWDIRCGVPHAATTIAIASGKTSADKLRAENPDHFFESAEDLVSLRTAILG